LRAGDLAGVTLVGDLTTLDATLLPGLRDLIMQFHLEAKPGILGSCSPPCNIDADCNDLNVCNGVETCISGRCAVRTPAPCDDGDLCTENDVCGGGTCGGTLTPAAAACNAGNGTVCDGIEACNPTTGACDPGTPLTCDDSNACTDDSCDAVLGCFNIFNTD